MTKTKYEAMCRECYPCKKCQGTGQVIVSVNPTNGEKKEGTCPACKGTKYFLPYDLRHGHP